MTAPRSVIFALFSARSIIFGVILFSRQTGFCSVR
jgi:hypothetical protein